MNTSETIRVWVRALGKSCRIRVETAEHADWLLELLRQEAIFDGLENVDVHTTESGYMFEIPNTTDDSLETLERELTRIPNVDLMLQPESI